MRAPIGRLDDQIVAIVDLVGQAALDHPSDQRAGIRRAGIVDGLVRDGGSIAARGIGALHGTDDVAALAHAAQRVGRSEEHTSALTSPMRIWYAGFCLKK